MSMTYLDNYPSVPPDKPIPLLPLAVIAEGRGLFPPLPGSRTELSQEKKQQLELDMEQRTASKLGKENIKPVSCHPAYLTYMHSSSCEMLGWMTHKLESRFPGEISTTSEK